VPFFRADGSFEGALQVSWPPRAAASTAIAVSRDGETVVVALGFQVAIPEALPGTMHVFNRAGAELAQWTERRDVGLVKTVDPGGNGPNWDGQVGFVPTILGETAPAAANSIALVCGPPIMIKFTLPVLEKLGFTDEQIYTTLENRMKCGLGKCGRCNVGNVYVCKDGPVFTAKQVKAMPAEF